LADPYSITIISGGQTGADRAALDFAIEQDIRYGGWCPRGRLAEDGRIPPGYELRETPSRKYAVRTEWNIRDSDVTVVFSLVAEPAGGTRLTLELAKRLGKPVLHLSRDRLVADVSSDGEHAISDAVENAASQLRDFLDEHIVQILNVAGPRASQEPEVAAVVASVLHATFSPQMDN